MAFPAPEIPPSEVPMPERRDGGLVSYNGTRIYSSRRGFRICHDLRKVYLRVNNFLVYSGVKASVADVKYLERFCEIGSLNMEIYKTWAVNLHQKYRQAKLLTRRSSI